MLIKRLAVLTIGLICFSCASNSKAGNVDSRNIAQDKKLETLGKYIEIKSPVQWAEYLLYDVNQNDRSIPGASHKDLKIVIKIDPEYMELWLTGKEGWITSFPHKKEWVKGLLNKEESKEIDGAGFITYRKEDSRYQYTLWSNKEKEILIISYQQE